MLKIKDLTVSKELDSKDMAAVAGGLTRPTLPSVLVDGSVSLDNKVIDSNQLFGFDLDQTNAGQVTNNQRIDNKNGIVFAPVTQRLDQSQIMNILGLGNSSIA